MKVRTRIAPSPTGSPHIGTAYIALFNYAFAKHQGGEFILRIEDTDRERSSRESEEAILSALKWLGLSWDEGPDGSGPFGPYRQSERLALYQEHSRALAANGAAYPCFCTVERLADLRRAQAAVKNGFLGYDGRCAALSAQEAERRIQAGEAHVLRLRVPAEGECALRDGLRGEVRIPWNKVDHQVLLKADGFPTYHLANVVDDHLMEISHVIRGEEWLSSLPKHILLYKAFGWTPPQFFHLPLLRNPDKTKLSKRRNPVSILYYQRAGILPEALLNYLGLLAYSFADGREQFTLAELAEGFDIKRISLGGPIFDLQKLQAFNGRRLRALSLDELWGRLKTWGLNEETWRKILPLAQPRLNQLADLVPLAAFLFADSLSYATAALLNTGLPGKRVVQLLRIAQWEIEKSAEWSLEALKRIFGRIAQIEALKLKELLAPFYIAISGAAVSLPLFDSILLLGRDMTLRRLHYALAALAEAGCALTKDDLAKLEKAYRARYGVST
ncbi:MAG: glutamate--tRNA ligase [Lentisphaerae bacterium]|nr:glutamate--tRNA ligase [Lentisphaerota bacterium]